MRTIKTGNELFDIFWQEYPPRINGAGVMEKKRKGPALQWFKSHSPSEELVCDMVRWLKRDKECRDKSEIANKFYSPPPDAIVFLNQGKWEDEIGVVTTKTQHREAHRSKSVYSNNVKALIGQWQGVIKEWPPGKLKASKAFMAAAQAYPEFAKWALEQRPDLKGAKPGPPKPKPIKLEPVGFGCEIVQEVLLNADLPPPQDDDFTGQSKLVDDFVKKYNLFENNS